MSAFYIASRTKHADKWREYKSIGLISTWVDEAGAGETASFSDLWVRIVSEVARSDFLVFYAEPDDFPLKGALIEVGVALALHKPVIACLPNVELEERNDRPVGSWIRHPLVKREDRIAVAIIDSRI